MASGIIKSRVPLDLAINDIGGPEELKRRIEEAKHAYEAAPESMPGRKFVMQAAVDPLTWVPVTLLKAPGLGLKAGFEATVKAAETGPRLIRPLASAAVKVIDMGGETFSNLYTIYRVDPVNYKELLEMIRRRGRMPGVIWADEMRENLHIYGRASGAFGLRGRRGVVSGTYGLTPEQAVAVGDVNSTWLEDLIQEKPWMFKAESVGLSPEAGALTFDDLVDPTVRDIAKYLKEVKGPVVEAYKLAVDPNIKFVAGPYQHRYFAEKLKQSIREAMSPGLGWRKPGFTYRRQEQVVESGLLKDPQLVVALDSASARLAFENDDRIYTPADLLPFCEEHKLPFVYDVHHHRCLPDALTPEAVTRRALKTWDREPLFHLSSPRDGWGSPDPRPHHDYIDLKDFPACWRGLDITIEVEAKAKELAIARLREQLEKVK